jgi:hypothetical protein
MPGDRPGLDQARVLHVQPGGQRQQRVLGHDDGLGHAAVAEDAEMPVPVLGAPLGVPAAALGALTAVDRRLDEPGPPGLVHAGELVTVDEPAEAGAGEQGVGAADPGRGHIQAHPLPAWLARVVDLGRSDPVSSVDDRAQVLSPCSGVFVGQAPGSAAIG